MPSKRPPDAAPAVVDPARGRRTLTLSLDGESVRATEGQTVAAALLSADKISWARSTKLHRPRGASCQRGGCDGCLARIDGVPNRLACLVLAREGMVVESQNVLGTRNHDLLRVTDWFFPKGIDHHHFLAGVPGAAAVMQTIARRVAGLGELPAKPRAIVPAKRTEAFAVVVGSGPSGRAAAARLAQAAPDRRVLLVDDQPFLGGSSRAFGHVVEGEGLPASVERRPGTTAGGIFGGEMLLVSEQAAEIVKPVVIVLATGRHDGLALFGNNDLPGVYSARAACLLAHAGVCVGEKVVVVGQGPFVTEALRLLGSRVVGEAIPLDRLRSVEGTSRVHRVRLAGLETGKRSSGAERAEIEVSADALIVDAPTAASFELAEQAGATIYAAAHGYAPRDLGDGKIAPGVFMTGELRGVSWGEGGDDAALVADGERVAEAVLGSLGSLDIAAL
jgi:sarcosine oxidase, subunit alpha